MVSPLVEPEESFRNSFVLAILSELSPQDALFHHGKIGSVGADVHVRFERRLSRPPASSNMPCAAIRTLRVAHVGRTYTSRRALYANFGQVYGLLGDNGDILAVNGLSEVPPHT